MIESNLSGAGPTGSHLRYEPSISSLGKFIGFAKTEMNIPGSGTTLYETAMKMQHIRGYITRMIHESHVISNLLLFPG